MKLDAVAVLLVAFSALCLPASGDPLEQGGRYVPGAGITIWCSADNHNIVPIGDPEDHPSPTSWLFSGEPECAWNDALNAAGSADGEEPVAGGFGGFAWKYGLSQIDTLATAWTDDDLFGADASYLELYADGIQGAVSSAGCGPQTIVLPEPNDHWGAGPPFFFWAFISVVGVTDDLTACFSSTGWITATYGT